MNMNYNRSIFYMSWRMFCKHRRNKNKCYTICNICYNTKNIHRRTCNFFNTANFSLEQKIVYRWSKKTFYCYLKNEEITPVLNKDAITNFILKISEHISRDISYYVLFYIKNDWWWCSFLKKNLIISIIVYYSEIYYYWWFSLSWQI